MSETFDPRAGLIVVMTRLWKSSTSFVFRFALDTGATRTVATPESLSLLGYDLARPSRKTTSTSASRDENVDQFVVERVQALGDESHDLLVSCQALPAQLGVDGLLGLDFFRERRLILDFRAGRIILE